MQVLNVFHVLIAIAMISFILVQKGAGATAGAAFGSGASGTVFGARGAGNFLSRSTWVLAALFCLISLSMAVIASRAGLAPEADLGVVGNAPATEEVAEQAIPEPPVAIQAEEASDLPAMDAAAADQAAESDLPVIEQTVPAVEEAAEEEPGGGP